MTSVSIVMATYNGARFLQEQLDSLSAQTCQPLELIVSDDHSTDATLSILNNFRDRAPFPVLIVSNPERLGYGQNFISATAKAQGDLIAFCDQDDVWHTDKLATAVRTLEQDNSSLFVHAAILIDEQGRTIGAFDQGTGKTRLYRPLELKPWGVFYGFSMVFKRSLLGLIDPTLRGGHTFEDEGLLSHDLWIYFLATTLGSVSVSTAQLASYRQHGNNQTPHVRVKWLRRLKTSMGITPRVKLQRGLIAEHRSQLLTQVSQQASDPTLAEIARRSALYWHNLSLHEQSRRGMLSQQNHLQRLRLLIRSERSGAYLHHQRGGLGRESLAKDILIGFLNRRKNDFLKSSSPYSLPDY